MVKLLKVDSLFSYIKDKSNRKNLITVAVLLLALPVGLILLRTQQIFNPRASIDPIVFSGSNVEVLNGRKVLTEPEVTLQITSKLGGVALTPASSPVSSLTPAATPAAGAEGTFCRPEVEACGANLKCAQSKTSSPSNSVAGKCVKNDSPTAVYVFDKTGITENSSFMVTISNLEPTGHNFANVALRIDNQYVYLGGPAAGPYTYSVTGLTAGKHEVQLLAHCEYKDNAPPDCSKADVKFNTINVDVLTPTTSLPGNILKFIGSLSPFSLDFGEDIVPDVNAQEDIRERCDDRILHKCKTPENKDGTMFIDGGVLSSGRCVRDDSVSRTDGICYENLTVIGGQVPGSYATPASYVTPSTAADLSQSVTNCKGEVKTLAALKQELVTLGWDSSKNGSLDTREQILNGYTRTACPNGNPNTNKIMTCNGPKTVAEMQAELRAAGGGEVDSSRAQEVYNKTTCKGGTLNANGTVTTCKAETISMAQFDEELKKSGFNVSNPTINDKFEGYRQAACPLGNPSNPVQTCKTPLNLGGPTNIGELMRDVRAANFPDQGFRTTNLQQAIIAYNLAQPVCNPRSSAPPAPTSTPLATAAPIAGICRTPRDFSKVARGLVVQNPMSADPILSKVCSDSGQGADCKIQVVSHYKGFDSEDPNNQSFNTEVISANGKFWVLGKVGSATGNSGYAQTSRKLIATGNNTDLEDFNQICKFRPDTSKPCILDNISHFKGFDTESKKDVLYNVEFISGYGKFAVLADINLETRLKSEGVDAAKELKDFRKLANGRYVLIEGNLSDAFPTQCQGRTTDCKIDVVQHFKNFDTSDAQKPLFNTELITAYGKWWVLGNVNASGQRASVGSGNLTDIPEFAQVCSCGTGACVIDEISHFNGFDNDNENVEYVGGYGWYWVLKSLQITSTPNPTPTPPPSGAPTPTATPKATVYTTSVKIAETRDGLVGATAIPYASEPLLINYQFQDKKVGQKFIFVEYTASDGTKSIESAQIELVEKPPTITSLSCVTDLQNPNTVKFTVKGERLGTGGDVKVGSRALALDGSWSQTEVKATFNDSGLVLASPSPTVSSRPSTSASASPSPTSSPSTSPSAAPLTGLARRDGTTEYTVTLTRTDGRSVSEKCSVGQTQLSLGAQLFCREPNSFVLNDVDMVLVRLDGNGNKTTDKITGKVTIDTNGYIKLANPLQDGQTYEVSLKAPRSLRRVAKFTAAGNTNSVPSFILPVGDVAPLPNGDGAINTLDRGELNIEWKVLTPTTTVQPADFNRDLRVNSIDWACMRYDFGSTSQAEP